MQQIFEKAQDEDPTRTSITIAHRLSTIRLCNPICVLQRGRVIESGSSAELMERRGVYYHMVNHSDQP